MYLSLKLWKILKTFPNLCTTYNWEWALLWWIIYLFIYLFYKNKIRAVSKFNFPEFQQLRNKPAKYTPCVVCR
jgi:hypothetical protein